MLPASLLPHGEAVGRSLPDSPREAGLELTPMPPHDCSFTAGSSTWKQIHEAALFQGYKGGSPVASSSPYADMAYKEWPSHYLMQPVRIWEGFAASLQQVLEATAC